MVLVLNIFKKTLPMFVFISALYVGLNETTFLSLFRKGFSWILSNFRFLLKPLLLEPFHIKVLLYLIHLHWWIMTRDVCSPLWVAASKCLVGDLSWHLHKAGYHWVFQCHCKTQSHCKFLVFLCFSFIYIIALFQY